MLHQLCLIAPLMLTVPVSLPAPALPPSVQDEQDDDLTKQAVEQLEEAFRKGEPGDRKAMIDRWGHIADDDVIFWVARGLRDRDIDVQLAAMRSLGHMDHPEALKELHHLFTKDKRRLLKDEQVLPVLFTEIARHGDEESVAILTDSVFKQTAYPTLKARIFGLGNIRSKKSVEGLFGMMKKVSFDRAADYMDDLRLSLYLLTGQDQGSDPRQWDAWWRRNKKSFRMSSQVPELPKAAQERWDHHWGTQRKGS